MDHCIAADEVPTGGDGHWLMTLLQDAYDQTFAWGATTVLLAAMEDSRRLVVANVGDCGLLVLRPEPSCPSQLSKQFRTEELRYEANRPKQVMRLANTMPAESHLVIQGARMSTVDCSRGDLIVLGSDGIFDNLSDEEIASIVERHCGAVDPTRPNAPICTATRLEPDAPMDAPEPSPDRLAPTVDQLETAAAALVDAAINNVGADAMEPTAEEPAGEASRREKPGGNADDTTAIVALVVEADDIAKADFEEPIQVPRETFRVGTRKMPVASGADGWAGGGLLGIAGIIPYCCNTTVDRQDELEEYFMFKDPKKSSPYKTRKDLVPDITAEKEQCTIT